MLPIVQLWFFALALASCSEASRQPGPLPIACAAYDRELIGTVEWLGQEQRKAPQELADAFLELLRARNVCGDGQVDDALAIYAGVAATLEP